MKVKSNSNQSIDILCILIAMLLLLLTGCSEQNENEVQSVNKEIGGLRFLVEYQPSANKVEEEGNGIEYFKIRLEKTNDLDIVRHLSETSGLTQEEVLYYLSYRLKDDIFLEQGEEKKESVLYHFERSYDLTKGRVVNVGFEPADKDKKITLLIDSELLNVGPVKLKF